MLSDFLAVIQQTGRMSERDDNLVAQLHPPVALVLRSAKVLPDTLVAWLRKSGVQIADMASEAELMARALRGRPRLIVLDSRDHLQAAVGVCSRVKADSYTSCAPTVLICSHDVTALQAAFGAGADEVLHDAMTPEEVRLRLDGALRRSDRDVEIHPTTRLPGTVGIETELARRIASNEIFAMCYVDLDHFKEYNDRYSYHDGDRVIRLLSRILHDIVKGMCGEHGFIGHIGGDDFIFLIPADAVNDVCAEAIAVFDLLVPYQYSEPDRRAGYFFGKDRRGQLHRVPLMTVSIGVVTNERKAFTSPAQISELATEMKSYAKTLPGSVFAVDRRQEHLMSGEATPVRPHPPLIIGAQK